MDVAVNAVIFDICGEVLLTERRDSPLWCLPGGRVEAGETIEEAILREVDEEIGVQVAADRLIGVYSEGNVRIIPPARAPVIVIAIECSILTGEPSRSDEVRHVSYFPINSLPKNIIATHPRRIADALRQVAIIG